MLSRKDIFGAKGRVARVRKVEIPEWGPRGCVYVRMLPADEFPAIQKVQKKAEGGKESDVSLAAWWCVLGVSDAKGKRLFTDSDHARLLQEPLAAVMRCAEAFAEFNFPEDIAKKKN